MVTLVKCMKTSLKVIINVELFEEILEVARRACDLWLWLRLNSASHVAHGFFHRRHFTLSFFWQLNSFAHRFKPKNGLILAIVEFPYKNEQNIRVYNRDGEKLPLQIKNS